MPPSKQLWLIFSLVVFVGIILSLLFLTNSAFAGSCPMMAKNIDSKIEEAQKLRDAGIKAHEDGKHAESEKLLNQALILFM